MQCSRPHMPLQRQLPTQPPRQEGEPQLAGYQSACADLMLKQTLSDATALWCYAWVLSSKTRTWALGDGVASLHGACAQCNPVLSSISTCRQDTAALSQSEAQMTLADSGPKHVAAPLLPANGNAEEHADQAMSKSQAKRLRKKKRESKV